MLGIPPNLPDHFWTRCLHKCIFANHLRLLMSRAKNLSGFVSGWLNSHPNQFTFVNTSVWLKVSNIPAVVCTYFLGGYVFSSCTDPLISHHDNSHLLVSELSPKWPYPRVSKCVHTLLHMQSELWMGVEWVYRNWTIEFVSTYWMGKAHHRSQDDIYRTCVCVVAGHVICILIYF